MDIDKAAASTAALQAQIASMERTQQSLSDEIDELEQYSRRNCLVVHGLPENSEAAGNENMTEAFLKVAGSLGVHLDAGCIDRSHRMDIMLLYLIILCDNFFLLFSFYIFINII